MKNSELAEQIKKILSVELPNANNVIADGHRLAKDTTIGRTAFFNKIGVSSEAEYKEQCVKENKIMFHAHIGMGSWDLTAKALAFIYSAAQKQEIVVDRVGICLDRRMGLSERMRSETAAETGPMLETMNDWQQLGELIPIQPHMGDFMIGFPASVDNTRKALSVGVTTIGNLSQFFSHEAPNWTDHVTTTVETVKAIAILSRFKVKGVMLHSYLEDGMGAHFSDCSTIAGWAMLERYIVENLLGAKLCHCMGGLTTDPVKRSGWVFALDQIHQGDSIGSMIYGDTLSFGSDIQRNWSLIAEYLLWDILTQLKCPTGHAVYPLPITEAIRIPSGQEIYESQKFGRRVEETARRLLPFVDFSVPISFAKQIVSAGHRIFDNCLQGLKECGVDTEDPVQLLYLLKKMGSVLFEQTFGLGMAKGNIGHERQPQYATDTYLMRVKCIADVQPYFSDPELKKHLVGRRLLLASTDVHENAITILDKLLSESGAKVFYLGVEVNPDDVVNHASCHQVDGILLSTHNGMALDYCLELKKKMEKKKMEIPVLLGGVLNQKVENKSLPVNIEKDLKALGFFTSNKLSAGITNMISSQNQETRLNK